MSKETNAKRKELYAYVESLGVNVTPEVHAQLKKLVIEHANIQNAVFIERTQQLEKAAQKNNAGQIPPEQGAYVCNRMVPKITVRTKNGVPTFVELANGTFMPLTKTKKV